MLMALSDLRMGSNRAAVKDIWIVLLGLGITSSKGKRAKQVNKKPSANIFPRGILVELFLSLHFSLSP